jgi:hypothetical protein
MLFEQEERAAPAYKPASVLEPIVCQDPSTPQSCIFSHLKSPVDGSNCPPAARHALGDFEDGHISIVEERYDLSYLSLANSASILNSSV